MENGHFEDVFPLEDGDVPASYVSYTKGPRESLTWQIPGFFPETWLEKMQWARKTEDHQRFWFDRLCVYQGHQHQVLKAETITAIPAFIAQSKGLLVLWDDTRRFWRDVFVFLFFFWGGGGRDKGDKRVAVVEGFHVLLILMLVVNDQVIQLTAIVNLINAGHFVSFCSDLTSVRIRFEPSNG